MTALRTRLILIAAFVSAFLSLCFHRFVSEDIAPFFGINTDQGHYLKQAYHFFDFIKTRGYWTVITEHLSHDYVSLGVKTSSNLNFSMLASFLFSFFGAGRMTALLIPLGSFISLVAVITWVVGEFSRSWKPAAIAVGLLLWMTFPFLQAGGIADFRMDFSAACWFSIAGLLWCRFIQRPTNRTAWTAAATTTLVIVFRVLTIAYFGVILLPLFIFCVVDWRKEREGYHCALLPLIEIGFVTGAILFWDRVFIRQYYFGNHVAEALIRSKGFKWSDDLLFYPRAFFSQHLGGRHYTSVFLSVFTILLGLRYFRSKTTKFINPIKWGTLFLGTWFALSPLLVLTFETDRAAQVAGISAPIAGAVLFLGLLKFFSSEFEKMPAWIIFLFLSSSLLVWQTRLMKSTFFLFPYRVEASNLNSVYESVLGYLTTHSNYPIFPPRIYVLDFVDGLDNNAVIVYAQEHKGFWQDLEMDVPREISPMSTKQLLDGLEIASVVIALQNPDILKTRIWPVARSIEDNYPVLMEYVSKHFKSDKTFTYIGGNYALYFRND